MCNRLVSFIDHYTQIFKLVMQRHGFTLNFQDRTKGSKIDFTLEKYKSIFVHIHLEASYTGVFTYEIAYDAC